jgi:hypothetical protein
MDSSKNNVNERNTNENKQNSSSGSNQQKENKHDLRSILAFVNNFYFSDTTKHKTHVDVSTQTESTNGGDASEEHF